MTRARQGPSPEDILVGGQAVIEGVMMRTPRAYAVAVRRADGSLEVKKEPVRRISEYWKPLSLPVVRGFAVLVQSLALGIRTLNFSFNRAMQDLEPENEKKIAAAKKKEGEFLPIVLSMAGAAAVAVFLFILAPLWITTWLKDYFTAIHNWVVFNVVDGLIRVVFFLAYILLISRMKDIRRVFQYHGAEHKSIYTYEAGETLTLANARKYSTLHPRCGTAFLLMVLLLSIVLFSLVFPVLPRLLGLPPAVRTGVYIVAKILLLVPIAGLSYEWIRFTGKATPHPAIRWLMQPGLWLQRLTTREPSDDQVEIGLCALTRAIALERGSNPESIG